MSWWREAVLYQIYPRSYADANGDGVGDLRGITSRLDHLAWLGVGGLWISPITVSPNADWGYDVSDYDDVDPALGTLDDLDELLREAHARGIKVLLDLVPNHTSDRHPWFVDARSSKQSLHRDWYVWADPREDGAPPNNWISNFGGPAWTYDASSGQSYLHQFLAEQPDLNWWSEDVRHEFDRILRFWFDRGVDGFRIDVCHSIVKDRELRDNPAPRPGDHPNVHRLGQKQLYNTDRPELHDVLRRWRQIADEYEPSRLLLGEVYLYDLDQLGTFFGDQLQLAFNFAFLHAPFDANAMRAQVAEIEHAWPVDEWPVWTGSNHDQSRLATRWCDNDPPRTRLAMLVLLTLRGTPVLYYGDEIGMVDTPISPTQKRDPVGGIEGFWRQGRDPERTPMHWSPEPGAGFTTAGTSTWLPVGDHVAINVADQLADRSSLLWLVRDLIGLRSTEPDLVIGAYEDRPQAVPHAWVWTRGGRFVVATNFSETSVTVSIDGGGVVRISTDRHREGAAVVGTIGLGPWEGVIVDRGPGIH